MSALVAELLEQVDEAIAEVLRAAGWKCGQRPDEWIDPASGKAYSAATALARVRRDVRP